MSAKAGADAPKSGDAAVPKADPAAAAIKSKQITPELPKPVVTGSQTATGEQKVGKVEGGLFSSFLRAPSQPSGNGSGSQVPPMPASVPAPSVVGTAAAPPSIGPSGSSSYAKASSMPAPPVSRHNDAQLSGTKGYGYGQQAALSGGIAAAQKSVGSVPHAVEIVSRAPTAATMSMPPASMPTPPGVQAVGPAKALEGMSWNAVGHPNQNIPKTGPAAVAMGRAALRGDQVLTTKKGKPATSITKKYQFIFITSEVAPWSKTGGLGEAMDGLPVALAALGHRVMSISPRYDQYAEGWDCGNCSEVTMGNGRREKVHCFHAFQSKVDRVFVDHDCFLAKVNGKTESKLYGPDWGKDYADNQWRFSYFAKACMKIIQELPLGGHCYGPKSFVIFNDWHSSLFPVYLEMEKKAAPQKWADIKTAVLIHNAVFQGRFDAESKEPGAMTDLSFLDIPEALLKQFTFKMPTKVGKSHPKVQRCINWMAAGCLFADRILTVSPTYAWELTNLPEKGVELEDIFVKKGVTGIVNGVKEGVSPDNKLFATKVKLPSTFTIKDVDEKKASMKAMIQKKFGLTVSPNAALCVFVGRMDLQKGFDYILASLERELENLEVQLITIGTGRTDLVTSLKTVMKKHPKKIYHAGWMGPERYAVVAAADFNLMPSRWEPCGLAQMESMRFGTLPVISQTGGLVDTVDDNITGIHLAGAVSDDDKLDPLSVQLVTHGLKECVKICKDPAQLSKMRKAAMVASEEFTWANSALQYEMVAEELKTVDVLPMCPDNLVTVELDKVTA